MAIDDISIRRVGCPMPKALLTLNIDDVSAKFEVSTFADAESYEYRLCKSNDIDSYQFKGSSDTKII